MDLQNSYRSVNSSLYQNQYPIAIMIRYTLDVYIDSTRYIILDAYIASTLYIMHILCINKMLLNVTRSVKRWLSFLN